MWKRSGLGHAHVRFKSEYIIISHKLKKEKKKDMLTDIVSDFLMTTVKQLQIKD